MHLLPPALALIFDLDGVIYHSTPLHTKAWEIYLAQHGLDPGAIEARMHGKRNDEIVRDYFGPGLDRDSVLAHGAAKERLFREMMRPQLAAHIVPGVREFLERHCPSPKAVASNAEVPNIEFVLDEARLRHYFRFVIDGHQVERPKPHPGIYLKAAELLETNPANCIVFEDSLAGIEAASSAGTRVVGLATTLANLPLVELEIPDFLDPRLASWLAQQKPA
jgi:HAD superfamily hydrolase (TIGR01509 family)